MFLGSGSVPCWFPSYQSGDQELPIVQIIYLIRNPRDVVVSNYYFKNHVPFLKNEKPFDDYLHGFIRGDMHYGSWFDHTLGWLTRRNTENFLLMSYEELQRVAFLRDSSLAHVLVSSSMLLVYGSFHSSSYPDNLPTSTNWMQSPPYLQNGA
ncbi:bile salt sulfotransferase-like protein [Cricetulus griseus]|uniref:Sulfotransferase n=1 Tax=Cricetulus griseus TaxID=10029 RepID=A0A061HTJ8_CRIGR|nr:bile salt sulfotransferase-like protein [Cricetulus griseus]